MKTHAKPMNKVAATSTTNGQPATKRESWPVFTQRFGKTVRQAGVTAVPRVLLTGLAHLKITPLQCMVLLQLIACWGKNGKHPFPGRRRLQSWLDCDKRTLDRAMKGLVDLGLVDRRKRVGGKSRRQTTNEYDLTGLIERLKPLARRALEERKSEEEKRQAAEAH